MLGWAGLFILFSVVPPVRSHLFNPAPSGDFHFRFSISSIPRQHGATPDDV